MKPTPSDRNIKLYAAIAKSAFGSTRHLAMHLGVPYTCLYTYLRLERAPVDRNGYVKYDAAALCQVLDCTLEELFPEEFIDRPYHFRDSYDDGYGQRAFRGRLKKYFPDRRLTSDQVDTLIALLNFKAVIPPDAASDVAEELVRRIPQDEYDVFSRFVFDGMPMKDIDAVLGIGGKAVRVRHSNALKLLNSPVTLKVIRAAKTRSRGVPATKGHPEEIACQPEHTGAEPKTVFHAPYEPPGGPDTGHIRDRIQERTTSARKGHLDAVLGAWRALPDLLRSVADKKAPQSPKIPARPKSAAAHSPRDDRVTLDEDTVAELCALRDESGKGPRAMLAWAVEHGTIPPPGLAEPIIAGWLSGRIKSASAEQLSFAKAIWSRIRECEPRLIPLNAERREALRRWRSERLLPGTVFDGVEDLPDGLRPSVVGRWLSDPPARVREDHLNWVLCRCEALATSPDRRVRIEAEIRNRLRALRERTGVGTTELLREGSDCPPGLTDSIVNSWLSGQVKSARRSHIKWVLAAWEERRQYDFITLTQGDTGRIADLLAACGIGVQAALRSYRGRMPEGMTSDVIQSWLSGSVRLARREHFEFVLSALQTVFEDGQNRFELTREHVVALEAERIRTGTEIAGLVRGFHGLPDAPTASVIHSWFSGTTRSARQSDYDLVLGQWRSLPDLHRPDTSILDIKRYGVRYGRVVLNDEIRERLRTLSERTGISGTGLIRQAQREGIDIPARFTHNIVGTWMNGSVKAVRPDHLEFAIAVWESAPTAHEKVALTDAHLAALRGFRDAGVLPGPIFDNADSVPEGLRAPMISQWLSGHASTARTDHLDWVLARCAAVAASDTRRVPVTPEVRGKLKAERERAGIGIIEFIKTADDAPDGLTASMISAWMNGHVGTARRDHLAYVIARWKALPDALVTSESPGFRG